MTDGIMSTRMFSINALTPLTDLICECLTRSMAFAMSSGVASVEEAMLFRFFIDADNIRQADGRPTFSFEEEGVEVVEIAGWGLASAEITDFI